VVDVELELDRAHVQVRDLVRVKVRVRVRSRLPDAVRLERVDLEPAVVREVGEGLLDLEAAECVEELALAQRPYDRSHELEVVGQQRVGVGAGERAEL